MGKVEEEGGRETWSKHRNSLPSSSVTRYEMRKRGVKVKEDSGERRGGLDEQRS